MAATLEQKIFKQGSTTHFISALFLPKTVRDDVFDLYSFVRTADDYVDQIPVDTDGFYHLRSLWEQAIVSAEFDTEIVATDTTDERVTKNMVRLARKYAFDPEWAEAFLDSMQADLIGKQYETIDDTLEYIYGSAEVIGLMMTRILGLDEEAEPASMMQGRAMQMINFIRDIDEDTRLGRQYFPANELRKFGLPDLTRETATRQPEDFVKFVRYQIARYKKWQAEATGGYVFIPKRSRVPIKAAADMYNWTADRLYADPHVVYRRKVKPSRIRVTVHILTNYL